jgi:hypothetical protein
MGTAGQSGNAVMAWRRRSVAAVLGRQDAISAISAISASIGSSFLTPRLSYS